MNSRLTVYCADVGSVAAGNFGWAASRATGLVAPTTSMEGLAKSVADDLVSGIPVALGFECPLFVPIAAQPETLTSARSGEGSRPWSAGAGCGALATGLVQVVWVLRRIRELVGDAPMAFLDWTEFSAADSGLFLWEAFVSATAKRESHVADAESALEAFAIAVSGSTPVSAVNCVGDVYSLIGAALLRTGWSKELSLLSRSCLVVRSKAAATPLPT